MKSIRVDIKKIVLYGVLTGLVVLLLVVISCDDLRATTSSYIAECLTTYRNRNAILRKCESRMEKDATSWLLKNMRGQFSYDATVSQNYLHYIKENQDLSIKKKWLGFNAQNRIEPELLKDTKVLTTDFLWSNIKESIQIWQSSPWSREVSFDNFCKFILPYKIGKEPVVDWKPYYRNKYSFLIEGVENMEEAFKKIHDYEIKNFPVIDTFFPYEQDPILLDELHGGNCRQRTYHMAYVMRALGLPAAIDYTPIWANYSENGHYWVSLVDNSHRSITPSRYIDGTYESFTREIDTDRFTCTIDSLKKIAKVYRITFEKAREGFSDDDIKYDHLRDLHTYDVTSQYANVTTNNIIDLKTSAFSDLYVCTYSQVEGWIPVGTAERIDESKVNIGPMINDNVIVVSEYTDGCFVPISLPYLIRHNGEPREFAPDFSKKRAIRLNRKYMLRCSWVNRWDEVVGSVIETSNDRTFANDVSEVHTFTETPTKETITIPLGNISKRYLRIMPKDSVYPVFAELQFLDEHDTKIDYSRHEIYAVGGVLTGDTLVTAKLFDNKLSTTFFKLFPFWIGFDLGNKKGKVNKMRIIMWNDENQIQPSHEYELFYFHKGVWNSLGRQTANSDFLVYDDVPGNSILLLRDYTRGKEERIFEYEDGKQIWH